MGSAATSNCRECARLKSERKERGSASANVRYADWREGARSHSKRMERGFLAARLRSRRSNLSSVGAHRLDARKPNHKAHEAHEISRLGLSQNSFHALHVLHGYRDHRHCDTSCAIAPRELTNPPRPPPPPFWERMNVLDASSGSVATFRQNASQTPSCTRYCSTLER